MAKYKDTAEMEYTGKDNLSSTVKSITAEIKKQQSQVTSTTNKLDQYNAQLSQQTVELKKAQSAQKTATAAVEKYGTKILAAEKHAVTMKDQTSRVNQELSKQTKILNNTESTMTSYVADLEKMNRGMVRANGTSKKYGMTQQELQRAMQGLERETQKQEQVVESLRREHVKAGQAEIDHKGTVRQLKAEMASAQKAQKAYTSQTTRLKREINELDTKVTNATTKLRLEEAQLARLNNRLLLNTKGLVGNLAKISQWTAKVAKAAQKTTDFSRRISTNSVKLTEWITKISRGTINLKNLATQTSKVSSVSQKFTNVISKVSTVFSKAATQVNKYKTKVTETTSKIPGMTKAVQKETVAQNKNTKAVKKSSNALTIYQSKIFGTVGAMSGLIASAYAFLSVGNRLSTALITNDNVNNQYVSSLGEQRTAFDDLYEAQVKNLGVARQDYQTTALRIEQQAEQYGLTKKQAREYAYLGTQVASVASVMNTSGLNMEQSAERLISAFRGEAEAAELLGFNLSATRMDDYTEQLREAGVALDGSFGDLDSDVQMQIRMAAAIEQVAQKTGTTIDPITDMASAQEAMNRVMMDADTSLTEAQKAAIGWRISLNEIKEALRGVGVPLIELMTYIMQFVGIIVDIFAPALDFLIRTILRVIESFVEWIKSSVIVATIVTIVKKTVELLIEAVKFVIEKLKEWIGENVSLTAIIKFVIIALFVWYGTTAILIAVIALIIVKIGLWLAQNGLLVKAIALVVIAILIWNFSTLILIGIIALIILKVISWAEETGLLNDLMTIIIELVKLAAKVVEVLIKIVIIIIKKIAEWNSNNEILKRLLEIIEGLLKIFIELAGIIIQIVAGVVGALAPLLAMFLRIIGEALDPILKLLGWIIEKFLDLIEAVIPPLIEALQRLNDFLTSVILPLFEKFGNWIDTYIIAPLDKVIGKIQDVIGWFGDLFSTSEETAQEASANADAAKGSQEATAEQAATFLARYQSQLVGSAGRAYGNISQPVPQSSSSTTYNNNRQNVTFQVAGGYRKSLHELQRDAQVTARKKGVVLR